MPEFLFMLTKDDATVADCLEVYDQVRESDVRWVGFKDIGVPTTTLRELTRQIRADGRSTVLEIVSIDADAEARSIRTGMELEVDLIMGGTRADLGTSMLDGTAIRYFPFPGHIVGHPSVLEGTVESIAESARQLSTTPGVHGLDLLAYRWQGDVEALIGAVVRASAGPVVVAGSVVTAEQIQVLARAGAWGFTIGGAVFDRLLVPSGSLRDQVEWAVAQGDAAGVSPLPWH